MEVASLEIVIRQQAAVQANTDVQEALKKTSQVAKDETERIGGSFENLKNKILGVRSALTLLAGGFAFDQLVRTIAAFDMAMAKLAATTNLTNQQLQTFKQTSIELSVTSGNTATSVAGALNKLVSSGMDANQALASIKPTLDIAEAGFMSTDQAAQILVRTMNTFKIPFADVTHVADVFAQVSKSTGVNMAELGGSLRLIGPIATAAGQSLEQIAAAMGVLNKNGVEAGQASFGLRAVLTQLENPTKRLNELLAELGLKGADVNPKFHNLNEIFDQFAAKGASATQMMQAFGGRLGFVSAALLAQHDAFTHTVKDLADSDGAAHKMAETISDTLSKALERLSVAFSTMMVQTGEGGLAGALKTLVNGAANLVNAMDGLLPSTQKGATLFYALADAVKVALAAFAGFTAGKLVGAFAALVQEVMQLVTAMGEAATASEGLMVLLTSNPFALAIGALGAIVGALVLFSKNTRDATQAQTDFDKVLADSKVIDEKYQESLKALANERKNFVPGQLAGPSVAPVGVPGDVTASVKAQMAEVRSEIAKTKQDIEGFKKTADQAFATLGQGMPIQLEQELKKIQQDFDSGKVGITGTVAALTDFEAHGGVAALKAKALEDSLLGIKDGADGAKQRLFDLLKEAGNLTQELAGTKPRTDAMNNALNDTASIAKLSADALKYLGDTLKELGPLTDQQAAQINDLAAQLSNLDRQADMVGKSAADRQRQMYRNQMADFIANVENSALGQGKAADALISRATADFNKLIAAVKDPKAAGGSAGSLIKSGDYSKLTTVELTQAYESQVNAVDKVAAAEKKLADVKALVAAVDTRHLGVAKENKLLLDDATKSLNQALHPEQAYLQNLQDEDRILAEGKDQRLKDLAIRSELASMQLTEATASKELKDALSKEYDVRKKLTEENQLAEQVINSILTPMEAYEKKVQELTTLLNDGRLSQDQFNRAVEQASITMRQSDPAFQKLDQTASDLADSMTSFFGSIIDGTYDSTKSLADFGKQIEQIITKMLILQPLAEWLKQSLSGADAQGGGTGTGWLGGFFNNSGSGLLVGGGGIDPTTGVSSGGGGIGGIFGSIGTWLGSLFHEGGIVTDTGPGKMVPASTFRNAPRYHGGGVAGLDPSEVPAILQRDVEAVVPLKNGKKIPVEMSNTGRNFVANFIITTPSPSAFKSSQRQIMTTAALGLQSIAKRNGH